MLLRRLSSAAPEDLCLPSVTAAVAAEIGLVPGWSVAKVADVLGIQQATVFRLHELGKLPAEIQVPSGMGNRKWRWRPETVRAYAKRVHRTVPE